MLGPIDFVRSREAMSRAWGLEESLEYTRRLATGHYENFHVVSFLLPKRLHQDFYNVYAYCRWADDLGDETGDTEESLRLLAWWRAELDAMYHGRASHPVFVALGPTAERYGIPREPFSNLVDAFVQDQTVMRYRDWEELLAYCRNSANPVGRLVLYLCGYRDAQRQALSDFTCTALQLANFWQDVTVDWRKNRVYIPLEVLERHGCGVEQIGSRQFDARFQGAMEEAVAKTRELFDAGLPLVGMVERRLAIDIDLFSRGGMRILDKIEERGYNVLAGRPAISKVERARLLVGALARAAFSRAA